MTLLMSVSNGVIKGVQGKRMKGYKNITRAAESSEPIHDVCVDGCIVADDAD